jgi:rhodanese-related sulfurtransferase
LDDVRPIFVALRTFAEKESPELKMLKLEAEAGCPVLTFQKITQMLEEEQAVLLDLRSKDEFESAHMKGAYSLPFLEIPERMEELPNDKIIIVACRGPYCITSIECVDLLIEQGFRAYRYDGGIGEWQYQGGQILSD